MADQTFKWTVLTQCYNPKHPDDPDPVQQEVKSQGQSVKLGNFKGHAGKPVDANMAVYFIKNFLEHYEIDFFKQPHLEEAVQFAEAEKTPELLTHYKKLFEHSHNLHRAVFHMRYGVTIEKDMILKTLSQPGCEGLRFYLCGKRQPKEPGQRPDPYMHLSLVAVGVDKDGYDLNYKGCALKPNVKLTQGVDVPTNSLNLEYAPPPPYSFNEEGEARSEAQTDDNFFNRFILFNIAKYGTSTSPYGSV